MDRRLDPDRLVAIAEEHLRREDALLETANRYLFTDTNALTTATFCRYYHGGVPERLRSLADLAAVRYDLVFVCGTDVPYDDTWDRSGEANRSAFQRQVIGDLHRRKIPFFLLRGSLVERTARVRELLACHRKYMNPFDLLGRSEP